MILPLKQKIKKLDPGEISQNKRYNNVNNNKTRNDTHENQSQNNNKKYKNHTLSIRDLPRYRNTIYECLSTNDGQNNSNDNISKTLTTSHIRTNSSARHRKKSTSEKNLREINHFNNNIFGDKHNPSQSNN
ncbi:NDT80/PhoG-like protein [Reticulomyxa filosa]|uniref:NDT80/PhoG-like protein n=1 Tax=Reticulomyxa filosa TaxID=46433 RepID=X6NTB6_RETFI|nr:NDT80/PhoG-like protein [Reticulomyxa filosa]|eukprot:ETO28552.1 NDT80/PhoG-like protein [Reticulomyxa filosa]